MPRIRPINAGRDVMGGGSVGRQRINAPVEAFGSGRGMQQLAQGLAGAGRGIEQMEKRSEQEQDIRIAEADKARQQENNLKRDRSMLNFTQKMNFYHQKNSGRLDHEKNIKDYEKFRDVARQKAMEEAGVVDPNDVERFSLTLDRSTMGFDLGMYDSAKKIKEVEERAIIQTRLDEEKTKLINSVDQIESWAVMPDKGSSVLMEWYQSTGAGFIDAMNASVERLPNKELQDKARKDILLDMGASVIDAMSDKIYDHPAPSDYTDIVKSVSNSLYELNVFDKKQRDRANDMLGKKLGARITRDDNEQIAKVDLLKENVINNIGLESTNPGQQEVLMQQVEGMQNQLSTKKDPTGRKTVEEVRNFLNTKNGERSSLNYSKTLEVLLVQGPEEARNYIKQLESGNEYTKPDGTVIRVPGIDQKQAIKLRGLVKTEINRKAKRVATDAIKRLRKMSEDGHLYWMQYEQRSDKPSVLYAISPLLDIGSKLKDTEFEPLNVEVGEGAGFFNRAIPYASDWDQHSIAGKDFEALADSIMDLAVSKEIMDDDVLERRVKQLLIPYEKDAAMLAMDKRLRSLSSKSKDARAEILNKARPR